jgi:diguanylate cyclase (GGDEF)-like protein
MNQEIHTDALTGLYNRRFFAETLSRETARSDRYQQPLTMLILDVDHLKQVNDAHGHIAGDNVFKSLAAILRSTVRSVDFVFRYGGDEVCILLRCTNLEGGLCVRQRLRNNIETSEVWATLGYGGTPSVSIGVCEHTRGVHQDAFIKRAEAALLTAKKDDDEGEAGVPVYV